MQKDQIHAFIIPTVFNLLRDSSFLVNRGVSLYVVQGLLGHLHARTTQRYAHLTRETLTGAAELVQEVVAFPGHERGVGSGAANGGGFGALAQRSD